MQLYLGSERPTNRAIYPLAKPTATEKSPGPCHPNLRSGKLWREKTAIGCKSHYNDMRVGSLSKPAAEPRGNASGAAASRVNASKLRTRRQGLPDIAQRQPARARHIAACPLAVRRETDRQGTPARRTGASPGTLFASAVRFCSHLPWDRVQCRLILDRQNTVPGRPSRGARGRPPERTGRFG